VRDAASAAAAAAVRALNAGGREGWRGGGVRHDHGEGEHDVACGWHWEPARAVEARAIMAAMRPNARLGATETRARRCRKWRPHSRRAAVPLQLRVGHRHAGGGLSSGVGDGRAPARLVCLWRRRVCNGGASTDPKGRSGTDGILIRSHKGECEPLTHHLSNLLLDVFGSEEAALVILTIRVNQNKSTDVRSLPLRGRHGCEQFVAGAGSGAQSLHQRVDQQRHTAGVEHLLLVGVQQGKVESGQVNLVEVSLSGIIKCRQGKGGLYPRGARYPALRVEEIVHSLAR